jgi:choline dehydrogenase
MESAETHDVVIVGGGTAGAVLAARLTEDAGRSVCLIEGGPSDLGDERVLRLRNWINLLGTELDYDYPTTPQPRGNSNIRHSRARVLGGCSSHNTMISFLPLPGDFADWESRGAAGWGHEAMLPYYNRLLNRIEPVAERDRNAIAKDFVRAANAALGVPEIADFNAKPFEDGVGFFSVGYEPETNTRSSSSVAYLHPILDRPNLTLHLETWVEKLLVADSGVATGVRVRRPDGTVDVITAREEIVLCAGSIDTPRLLLHSGIGPSEQLHALGIDVVADVPGVGENLLDHPESVIVWETKGPLPP